MQDINTLMRLENIRGWYSGSWETGVIVAGAGNDDERFHFRWGPVTTNLCIVTRVHLTFAANTSFAAATNNQFALFRASAWDTKSAAGTAVTVAATCKRDSTFPSSLFAAGDIRIDDTDAAGDGMRGASTAVLEANAIGRALLPATSSTGAILPMTLFDANISGYPIVLRGLTAAAAEGLVVVSDTIAATGTWLLTVSVDWCETDVL